MSLDPTQIPSPRRRVVLLSAVLLVAVAAAATQLPLGDPPPPVPADPLAREVSLLYARPFVLDAPYVHTFRAEQPAVSSGWVLVLAVDPELVHPRQVLEPVLYAGAQTAERLNVGHRSGRVVALVPAPLDARGDVALDLAQTPIFFGDPALPEQVDAAAIEAQVAAARARGLGGADLTGVAGLGEPALRFEHDADLRLWSADLIEAYSPDEADLVAGLRAPRLVR